MFVVSKREKGRWIVSSSEGKRMDLFGRRMMKKKEKRREEKKEKGMVTCTEEAGPFIYLSARVQ